MKTFHSPDSIALVDQAERAIFTQALQTNINLKPQEKLLVVFDQTMVAEAALWFEAGKTISNNVQAVQFDTMTEHGQEPPARVAELMQQADIAILQTAFSLSHTQARKAANAAGTRTPSLPTAKKSMLLRTLAVDYQPIQTLSLALADRLSQAKTARVTSANGTDILFELTDRTGIADTGYFTTKQLRGNLPAGEAFIAPVEGKTNGVYVVDGALGNADMDEPVRITIVDGLATKIEGGAAAKQYRERIDAVGPLARSIAELGIGTNRGANPHATLLEAEKAYGTVHIALGNNATIGGTINVPFHEDGVILHPTLELDGQPVLAQGKFFLEEA